MDLSRFNMRAYQLFNSFFYISKFTLLFLPKGLIKEILYWFN